jgi:hypothetical protein
MVVTLTRKAHDSSNELVSYELCDISSVCTCKTVLKFDWIAVASKGSQVCVTRTRGISYHGGMISSIFSPAHRYFFLLCGVDIFRTCGW